MVKKFDANGEPVRGERRINPQQAAISLRIFVLYAEGVSPRAIAKQLNRKACQARKVWGPSTIHGDWQRGAGILNNELYVGKQLWNRLRYIKDPQTGMRISRLNPPSEWIIRDVPDLRIIDQDLWDQVKARAGGAPGQPDPAAADPATGTGDARSICSPA